MRTQKLIFRWSLVTSIVIALFWAIYYLIAGQVPVVTSVKMTDTWTIVLPFGISRWWDSLIGPTWFTFLILLLTRFRLDWEDVATCFVLGVIVSLVAGPLFGLAFGLSGPAVCLVIGFAYGLTVGLVAGHPFVGLVAGLFVGLVVGLFVGLVVGLVVGLAFSLVVSLTAGLIAGLTAGLTAIVRAIKTKFWSGAKGWMLAR